jgi:hypothetical protein
MWRKLFLAVACISVFLYCPLVTNGQQKSATSRTINFSLFLYPYQPKEIKSLTDLPEDIKVKVVNHLIARLGNSFYSKLAFVAGLVVDRNELFRVNPDTKNYRREIPAYELHFSFSEPSKGVKFYRAYLTLRSNGEVIKEIALPEISHFPRKANLISLRDATNIAIENGFPKKKMKLALDYSEEDSSIIWLVEGPERDYGRHGCHDQMMIDAHSAKVLKKEPQCGIY